jgi:Fe-S cluster assembly protein SufD
MKKIKFILKKNEKRIIRIKEGGTYSIELIGEGAEAKIIGGIKVEKGKTVSIHTVQHHQAPNTKSDLLVKSVVSENGNFSYLGSIIIDKKMQGSNAYQRNENLIVGENAIVETQPELEILANDVRCTHGATIGTIDNEQLFYLTSRGLSKHEAEKLIIEGFLLSVI